MSTFPTLPEVFPSVHLNGTGLQTLIEDYKLAYDALKEAAQAFHEIEFNARDYYVQAPGAFATAQHCRAEQQERFKFLTQYLEAHLEHLCDEADRRGVPFTI